MAGPRFSGVFLYLCLCVSSCQHNLNHSQCMYWRMSQFLQRTGQAMNKDAQVRHSTQLVLFIFKLFHIFNVRNWMNKSSCLWRLSLTGSWGGGGAGASPIYLRARREHVDRSSIWHPEQRSPNLPLPSHFLQFILGNLGVSSKRDTQETS